MFSPRLHSRRRQPSVLQLPNVDHDSDLEADVALLSFPETLVSQLPVSDRAPRLITDQGKSAREVPFVEIRRAWAEILGTPKPKE